MTLLGPSLVGRSAQGDPLLVLVWWRKYPGPENLPSLQLNLASCKLIFWQKLQGNVGFRIKKELLDSTV